MGFTAILSSQTIENPTSLHLAETGTTQTRIIARTLIIRRADAPERISYHSNQ
jgi:hypothetical protein